MRKFCRRTSWCKIWAQAVEACLHCLADGAWRVTVDGCRARAAIVRRKPCDKKSAASGAALLHAHNKHDFSASGVSIALPEPALACRDTDWGTYVSDWPPSACHIAR